MKDWTEQFQNFLSQTVLTCCQFCSHHRQDKTKQSCPSWHTIMANQNHGCVKVKVRPQIQTDCGRSCQNHRLPVDAAESDVHRHRQPRADHLQPSGLRAHAMSPLVLMTQPTLHTAQRVTAGNFTHIHYTRLHSLKYSSAKQSRYIHSKIFQNQNKHTSLL